MHFCIILVVIRVMYPITINDFDRNSVNSKLCILAKAIDMRIELSILENHRVVFQIIFETAKIFPPSKSPAVEPLSLKIDVRIELPRKPPSNDFLKMAKQ